MEHNIMVCGDEKNEEIRIRNPQSKMLIFRPTKTNMIARLVGCPVGVIGSFSTLCAGEAGGGGPEATPEARRLSSSWNCASSVAGSGPGLLCVKAQKMDDRRGFAFEGYLGLRSFRKKICFFCCLVEQCPFLSNLLN